MARYRFELPDGRIHESEATPARIHEIHPGAVITHEIALDDAGHFAGMLPYREARPAMAKAVPVETPASEPEMPAVKRVVKKAG